MKKMKNLKNYKTLKTELKKEINQQDFERFEKKAHYCINFNFYQNTRHTAGATPKYSTVSQFTSKEELQNVFGLPFTSTSNFAALWNTNTTCQTTEGKKISFLAVSINLNNKIVLIFWRWARAILLFWRLWILCFFVKCIKIISNIVESSIVAFF